MYQALPDVSQSLNDLSLPPATASVVWGPHYRNFLKAPVHIGIFSEHLSNFPNEEHMQDHAAA